MTIKTKFVKHCTVNDDIFSSKVMSTQYTDETLIFVMLLRKYERNNFEKQELQDFKRAVSGRNFLRLKIVCNKQSLKNELYFYEFIREVNCRKPWYCH